LACGPGFWDRNVLHGVYPANASKPFDVFEYAAQEILNVLKRVSCEVFLSRDFNQQVLSVDCTIIAEPRLTAALLDIARPYVTVSA
jgi:hypothetical protein